jgi:undecaprenyl diphosphate synthase
MSNPEKTSPVPACVGIIMDGNRRWAKQAGKPTVFGHTAGYENLKTILRAAADSGVEHVVCYAFSTENWRRLEEEVGYLMGLFERALVEYVTRDLRDLSGVSIHFIGDRSRFSERVCALMEKAEAVGEGTTPTFSVWVALNYGGRPELVRAVNQAVAAGHPVTEETFSQLLDTAGMPDPDLIIRTGGEMRLSNFLPWQSVYSELFFTDTLWPDFSPAEFQSILDAYAERSRRYGS